MFKYCLLPAFLYFSSVKAQTIYPYRVCDAPKALPEFSGLAKISANKLAAINDGGNASVIYYLDTLGKLIDKTEIKDVTNTDWEELFYENGILYIADVGDNTCKRSNLTLYHYELSSKKIIHKQTFGFYEKKIPLSRNKLFYDCEAGFIFNKEIFFFTKSHSKPYKGFCYAYQMNGKNKLMKAFDSTNFGRRNFFYNSITGAAIAPNGNMVAYISCLHVWLKIFPPKENYFKGYTLDFDFDGITQKEAITFLDNNKFVVADEKTAKTVGGRMYFFNTKPYLTGSKKYTKPFVKNAKAKLNTSKNTIVCSIEFTTKKSNPYFIRLNKDGTISDKKKMEKAGTGFQLSLPHNAKQPLTSYWIVCNDTIVFTGKVIL